MPKRLTLLETENAGVIVDGAPWSVWLALEDARRDRAPYVSLWRDKNEYRVATDVEWKISEWGAGL